MTNRQPRQGPGSQNHPSYPLSFSLETSRRHENNFQNGISYLMPNVISPASARGPPTAGPNQQMQVGYPPLNANSKIMTNFKTPIAGRVMALESNDPQPDPATYALQLKNRVLFEAHNRNLRKAAVNISNAKQEVVYPGGDASHRQGGRQAHPSARSSNVAMNEMDEASYRRSGGKNHGPLLMGQKTLMMEKAEAEYGEERTPQVASSVASPKTQLQDDPSKSTAASRAGQLHGAHHPYIQNRSNVLDKFNMPSVAQFSNKNNNMHLASQPNHSQVSRGIHNSVILSARDQPLAVGGLSNTSDKRDHGSASHRGSDRLCMDQSSGIMRRPHHNQHQESIYEEESTSRMFMIANNEKIAGDKEMKTLQQDRMQINPLLQSSKFDSAAQFEKMSEMIKQQDQLTRSSIFDTDRSGPTLQANLQNKLTDTRAINLEALKQDFINDTAKSVDSGTYGLPSIGGAISSKLSKPSRHCYNPHIVNNGSQNAISQYSTDNDFQLIKKKKKLNLDLLVKTQDQQEDGFGAIGDVSVSLQNSIDFSRQTTSKFPAIQPTASSKQPQRQIPQQTHQTHRSNASFNNIFKLTKANFKSPIQHKAGVLYSAAQYRSGANHEHLPPGISFKRKDEMPSPRVAAENTDDGSLDPSKKGPSLPSAVSPRGKKLNKPDSNLNSFDSRASDRASMRRKQAGRDAADQEWRNREKCLSSRQNESKMQEVDAVTGLNTQHYLIKEDFTELMTRLEDLGEERRADSIVDQRIKAVAQECKLDPDGLVDDLKRFFDKRAMIDASQSLKQGHGQQGSKSSPQVWSATGCQISKKSLEFLKGQKGSVGFSGESDASCDHFHSEEDIQIAYLDEYKRYLEFANLLKEKLRQDIPREVLIKSLTREVGRLADLTPKEKELFSSEEETEKLLKNPLLEIVMSIKELGDLRARCEQNKRQSITKAKQIYDSKGKLLVRRSTKRLLQEVSAQVLQDSLTLEELKEAEGQEHGDPVQRLLAKRRARGISRRETFIDLQKLISETEEREAARISLGGDGEKSQKLKQDFAAKRVGNQLDLYRIEVIKRYLRACVKFSIQAAAGGRKSPNIAELTADELVDRKYLISGIDHHMSDRAQKFLEKCTEELNNKTQKRQSIMLLDERKQQDDADSDGSASSQHDLRLGNDSPEDYLETRRNIFNDIERSQQFYEQAKREIIGYNKPPNQESFFFNECKNNNLLPQPIFKCVSENMLKYQGKGMSLGYAQALAKFIENNREVDHHILQLHLDDCSMKDVEFNTILEGVKKSKFGVSLQTLIYSNNEMGRESINSICSFIELGLTSPSRGLKELCLSNVNIKHFKDLRILTECIAEQAEQGNTMAKIKFQQMNLSDGDVVGHLYDCLTHNSKPDSKLHFLELSGCHLLAKDLMLIAEALVDNKVLRVLDLSGNGISELVEENQIKQALFLQYLAQFIASNQALYSLNLEGLLLGKKLLYLLDVIKSSRSLLQVNLTSNLLNKYDEAYIFEQLAINPNPKQNHYENLLEKYDMCYQQSHNKFKNKHLNEENKNHNQKRGDVVNSIINSGIVKQLRTNRNLQKKLTLNSSVGEVIAGTGSKSYDLVHGQSTNTADRVSLRRYIGYNELMFNELGQDVFGQFDFNKPYRWEQLAQNDPSDVSELQYVMVYVDLTSIDEEFTLVRDQSTIDILMNQYGLDVFQEMRSSTDSERSGQSNDEGQTKINMSSYGYPIIFGTFSNWKAYQMFRAVQFTSALVAGNKEDRQNLLDHVFDDQNDRLKEDFKSVFQQVYPVLNAVTELQGAHVVGALPTDPALYPQAADGDTFVYAGFVQPGKHSIFIYDPESGQIHRRIIAVDVQESFTGSFITRELAADFILDDSHLSKYCDIQPEIQKASKDELEAFINDIQPGIFNIKAYFDNNDSEDLRIVLQTLKRYYSQVLELFYVLLSGCHDSYPSISFHYLREFCQKTQIISVEKLDATNVPNDDEAGPDSESKVHSQFDKMNRTQFLEFLIWAYRNRQSCKDLSFPDFMKSKILPLIKSSKYKTSRLALQNDEKIQELVDMNSYTIHSFIEKHAQMYGLTPREIESIVIGKAEVYTSEFNLRSFYTLSKNLVVNEQQDGREAYFNLSKSEFIECVYRIADHIYDRESYEQTSRSPEAEGEPDEVQPVQAPPQIPDQVAAMLDEPMHAKFKHVLQQILNIDGQDNTLIDSENIDQMNAAADKVGGGDTFKMLKFLPPSSRKEYLTRI